MLNIRDYGNSKNTLSLVFGLSSSCVYALAFTGSVSLEFFISSSAFIGSFP